MAGRTAAEAASEQETLTRDPLMLHRAIVTQDRLCSEMLAAFMCPAPKADCPLTAHFLSFDRPIHRLPDRRCSRIQPADGWAARRGQEPAGQLPARHPPAAVTRRSAGSQHGPIGRGHAGRRAHQPRAPVPRAASFGQHGRAHRGRVAGAAGRSQPRSSRRAVSRRAARIPRYGGAIAPRYPTE